VPLTDALFAALRDHRHLRGEHVLFGNDGHRATSFFLRKLLEAAQTRAGLQSTGGLHILRHSFCSHLAMRGAPAKAIQELAGHADRRDAKPGAGHFFGEMSETALPASTTYRNS
jgi:site-specific recombinase XerD